MTPLRAFISGTLLDLGEQRRTVIDVCLELGIQPIAFETLAGGPASTVDAVARPLSDADLVILIVGFRYGAPLRGADTSIVEMEYDLARKAGKPTLVFMMSDQHPVSPRDLDIENASRVLKFRERLRREQVPVQFGSVAELRVLARRTLREFVTRKTPEVERAASQDLDKTAREPFVAGPGQSSAEVVGRERELQRLAEWCNGRPADAPAPAMLILGHGGMGKTALAWRFFESPATQRFDRSGGRFWWSFFESPRIDAFQSALLEYATGEAIVERPTSPEQILSVLREREMLIVLDGVERLLIADSPPDITAPPGPFPFTSDYARRIADGRFQKLVLALPWIPRIRTILISRSIPADVESYAGAPRAGFELMHVGGLAFDDVVDLLHRFGVPGSKDELAELARKTAGVPLLARLLASQVMHTGEFAAEPDSLTSESSIHGLIGDALQRLTRLQSSILERIARSGEAVSQSRITEDAASARVGAVELDQILTRLENLQLVEWNRTANTYNVHPLVREAVMKASDS